MKTTTRSDKSLGMSLLHTLIRPIGQKLITPKIVYPAGSPKLTPHAYARKRCHITERQVCDVYIYDMVAKKPASALPAPLDADLKTRTGERHGGGGGQSVGKRRVYYFAGGAWQMPPSSEHWKLCTEICERIPGCTISVVSYPLAPNSPAPVAFPQLVKLYEALMPKMKDIGSTSALGDDGDESAHAQEIVTFAGDSAGGNIVLGLVLHVLATRGEAIRAPDSLLVISPTTDCTPQDPVRDASLKEAQKHDPILSAEFSNGGTAKWAGDWDQADSRLTVLNADVGVLRKRGVRLYGITGTWDVLTPPTMKFKDMCEREGVEGDWLHWDKQMHCFPLAWIYWLSESKMGKEWIVDVLSR